jgi:hypothetical protein
MPSSNVRRQNNLLYSKTNTANRFVMIENIGNDSLKNVLHYVKMTTTLLDAVSIMLITFEQIAIKTSAFCGFVDRQSMVLVHFTKSKIRRIFIKLESPL